MTISLLEEVLLLQVTVLVCVLCFLSLNVLLKKTPLCFRLLLTFIWILIFNPQIDCGNVDNVQLIEISLMTGSAKNTCEAFGGKLYKADLIIWSFQIRMNVLEDNQLFTFHFT